MLILIIPVGIENSIFIRDEFRHHTVKANCLKQPRTWLSQTRFEPILMHITVKIPMIDRIFDSPMLNTSPLYVCMYVNFT